MEVLKCTLLFCIAGEHADDDREDVAFVAMEADREPMAESSWVQALLSWKKQNMLLLVYGCNDAFQFEMPISVDIGLGCPARCILSMVDVCLCVRAMLSIMLSPGAQLLNAISRVVVLSWQGGRVHRKEASPIAICPPPLPSLPPPSDVPLHIYSRQTL